MLTLTEPDKWESQCSTTHKNERHPTAWHVRAYGLFAANNLFFKGGFTIQAGQSITYRYRVIFRRRSMTNEEISDRYVIYTLAQ